MAQEREAPTDNLQSQLDSLASDAGNLRNRARKLHQGIAQARDELVAISHKIKYTTTAREGEGRST